MKTTEFKLPETWYVVVTEENKQVLADWRGIQKTQLTAAHSIVGMIKWTTSYNYGLEKGHSDLSYITTEDYTFGTEITYEQFREYVLMIPTKKLIGYKLKDSKYAEAAAKLINYSSFGISISNLTPILLDPYGEGVSQRRLEDFKKLEDLGLLSLWFDEVYEEQSKTIFFSEKDLTVKISKNSISADGKNWNIGQIKELYNRVSNEFYVNGYTIKYPYITVGCKVFSKEDLKKIIDAYNSFQ